MAEPQREAQPHPTSDEVEADIDTVIAAFDGDTRGAVRSLLIANEFLMEEVDRLPARVSVGYARKGGSSLG